MKVWITPRGKFPEYFLSDSNQRQGLDDFPTGPWHIPAEVSRELYDEHRRIMNEWADNQAQISKAWRASPFWEEERKEIQ